MRWVVRLVGAIVLLAVLAFGALALIPSDRVAKLATDRFEAVTGRKLVIDGAVKPTLWPVLGVETGRVTLANAPWSDAGPMLSAKGLSIRLDLQALIGGEVRVTGFALDTPEIILERGPDGVGNWVFGGSNGGTASAAMAGADAPFTLDRATVTKGRLRWIDHGAGQDITLDGVEAELRLPVFAGPLTLSASAQSGGQPVSLDATVESFELAYKGAVVPVTLQATAGPARLSFDGRAGTVPLAAEGQLDADLGDLAAVSALAGLSPPALPEGFGANSVTLSGKVTRSAEGMLSLRGGRIGLDQTEVTGDIDLSLAGARPRLVGKLAIPALQFGSAPAKAAASGNGGSGGTAATASGWSDAPLSASGLNALDADLGLSVGALRLGGLALTDLRARVTVDAGRATIALTDAAAYGGSASGQIVLNARKGFSTAAQLALQGVALQPLLTDAAGIDRLVGTGDLSVDLSSGGGSVAALMQRLDGSGQLRLGPGEIRGLDIPALLASLNAQDMGPESRTVFDGLGATFTITNGTLSNDDLKMQSQFLRAKGNGHIGIAARDIDYSLRATALRGEDGADKITLPLRITGPWDDPAITLDAEALAREKLDGKAKEAAAELKRRAGKELGQKKGESLEDAAKRRLQEQLDDQTGNVLNQLLGGN